MDNKQGSEDGLMIDTPYGQKKWRTVRLNMEAARLLRQLTDRMDVVRFRGWIGHPLMTECRSLLNEIDGEG